MNETIIVTGDAGAIGSATAQLFLQTGRTVLGVDLVERDALGADGYHTVMADVADERAVEKALHVLEDLPPLCHVVAIAGGALPEEPTSQDQPWTMDMEVFRDSVERNLVSQFITVKTAYPWLKRSTGAERSITLTSSINALSAQGMPAYSAAKAGLIGMMHGLVGPLGAEGIRVNTVAPGTVRTPRTERIWGHVPGHFERLAGTTALGRLGEPEDIARAYRALALELTHVTGEVLVVGGGQLSRSTRPG
jgi:3-oxoacyl-[acyl-carrier protein] reductase